MMHSAIPSRMQRRGSLPGRIQRRASLSAKPERRGSMTGGAGGGGPSQIMLSWFQAAETVEEEEGPVLGPATGPLSPSRPAVVEEVQIMGLELLQKNSQFGEYDADDYLSYEDSYARDSFLLTNKHNKNTLPTSMHLSQSEHPVCRRRPSALGYDDDFDSTSNDYDDYGYDYRVQQHQRMSSTRRSSLGSYANDSVEYKHLPKSRFATNNNNALGVTWHGNHRYGQRRSMGRRGSLGSLTMDSSTGSSRFAAYNRVGVRVTRRHSSNFGEYGKTRRSFDGSIRRRSSLGSVGSGVSLSVATSISTGLERAT